MAHTDKNSAMSKIPGGTLQAETAFSMDTCTFTCKLQWGSAHRAPKTHTSPFQIQKLLHIWL